MPEESEVLAGFPPNESLKVFKPFIGDWNTVGSHAMIPDVVLHGKTTFAWHESGAFIIMHSNIEEDVGIPSGVAIIGSDNKSGTYSMIYYDERGISRAMQASMQDNIFSWRRDGPEFSQRYTFTISGDQQTIISKGELSHDGSTWEKDLDLTYSKAKPLLSTALLS